MRSVLTLLFISLFLQPATAQPYLPNAAYVRPLSLQDSLLVTRYLDSVNNAPDFSRTRKKYYDSALAIKPWRASWWQQRGMILMKQGRYEAGMRFLDSAVKYDCRRYIGYRAFMKCIFQKSYRAAIQDFVLAKSVVGAGEVMDHTYDFYIGLSYLMLDELDSARNYLIATINEQQKARGENYVHPTDLFYLAITYYDSEDFATALTVFDRCLRQYKNFSDAEYYKAFCLKRLNRGDEALAVLVSAESDFKQRYTINEDNVIHEWYPHQIYRQENYDNALKWMRGQQ